MFENNLLTKQTLNRLVSYPECCVSSTSEIEMSTPQLEYYFKPGRLMKRGRTNPGILIVERVRAFQCNTISKDNTIFGYVCCERLTIGVKCLAKATVMKCDIPGIGVKAILVKVDSDHDCMLNVPKAIAEEMRHEMKEIVRKDPHKPVNEAVRNIRRQYAEKYDDEDDLFDQIMAELGPDKPLEKQLLRVRKEIIGKTPINRDRFDPKYFLRRLFGKEHNIVTLDSNKLETGWRDKLSQKNPNTKYRWDNLVTEVREYEDTCADGEEGATIKDCPNEEEGHFDEDTKNLDEPEYPNLEGKDLPKRVLGFSSVKILKLYGKHLKSSLDGTFKSACFLWSQSFIWMVKYFGHWVPAVHAWLPDKTEQSYKVRLNVENVKILRQI